MSDGRCLMAVHAHPDDESEFAAGTLARYHAEGARTILVCCTDGGRGRILNPAVGAVGALADDVVEVRRRELDTGAAIIGFDAVVSLNFPDSGSVGLTERAPDCFACIPLEEAVRPIVETIRRERPHVVIAYVDDQRSYPHPDHLRAHEAAVRAFDAAGDVAAWPELGAPWQPAKLYYTLTSRERREEINAGYAAMRLAAPFSTEVGLQGRGETVSAPARERVTTQVDVGPWVASWIAGMRAHTCQMKPDLDALLDIPEERAAELFGVEEFILARDHTGRSVDGGIEQGLFEGIPDTSAMRGGL